MKVNFVFTILISALLIISCGKDKDTATPVISISSPSENQQFSALDTLQIKATITDEITLEQVEIAVCNDDKIPVLQTVSFVPQDKSITIDIPYALNDINLESGSYYVRIKASDGSNTTTKYRAVQINAVPRELKYVYITTIVNGTTIHLLRKVPGGNLEDLFDINGDFTSTASSSEFQLVASCGSIYGNMNVYSVSDNSLQWSVPVVSDPPFPYFESLCQYDQIFYCSFYDGFIRGYNNTGTQVFTAVTASGTYPCIVYANSDYLFADHGCYSGSQRQFSVYYQGSGTLKQNLVTDYYLTNIFQKNDDNLFLFGNQDGQGIIRLYSITGNGTWEPHTLPAGMIHDVVQIDAYDYIIAHESGLYKYQYDMNSLNSWVSAVNAVKIKYDDENSDIYAAHGNTIDIYDYASHTLTSSITVPDSIAGFELLYNKE